MIVERILQLIDFKGISKSAFYKETGLSNGFLDKVKDIGVSKVEYILNAYPDVSLEWLLTGQGEMLQNHIPVALPSSQGEGIPLIPVEAFAGAALNNGYSVDFDAIEDRYHVPLFDGKGVDFMMYVRGSSMLPKYSSGDVIACRFVKELLFIQWNKVYVIDSMSQGSLIKRLLPGDTPDYITCRSDNKDYIDFQMPKSDINNIALVVGCIRLE